MPGARALQYDRRGLGSAALVFGASAACAGQVASAPRSSETVTYVQCPAGFDWTALLARNAANYGNHEQVLAELPRTFRDRIRDAGSNDWGVALVLDRGRVRETFRRGSRVSD